MASFDLGPPVVGDPAGMRALAAQLGLYADELGARAADIDSAVAALTFEGPAAERMRMRVAGTHFALVSQAARLQQAAGLLVRAAAQVEAEQAARARLEQQLREQAERVGAPVP